MLCFGILVSTVHAEENYEELFEEDQKLIETLDANTEKMIEEDKPFVEQYLKERKLESMNTLNSSVLGTFGDILVDTTVDSGSIAFTGHAAIVAYSDKSKTVLYFKDSIHFLLRFNEPFKTNDKVLRATIIELNIHDLKVISETPIYIMNIQSMLKQ